MRTKNPNWKADRAEKQKERGHRQERRILAVISVEPLSSRQIAERVYMSVSSVQIYMRRMRERTPKAAYIAGYEQRSEGAKPSPLYAAGDKPDAPLLVRPRKTKGHTDYTAQRQQAILQALKIPRTSRQLAGIVNLSVSRVQSLLRTLRKPVKQVFIDRWESPKGRGDLSPVYVVGNRHDAKKPVMSRAERYRKEMSSPEKRNRKNAIRRARNLAKRTRTKPQNPFSALGL